MSRTCESCGNTFCSCHLKVPELEAQLATTRAQVRDLRAALEEVLPKYIDLAEARYMSSGVRKWGSVQRLEAALAATAEPEARR